MCSAFLILLLQRRRIKVLEEDRDKVEVRLIGKRRVKQVRVDGTKMTDTI